MGRIVDLLHVIVSSHEMRIHLGFSLTRRGKNTPNSVMGFGQETSCLACMTSAGRYAI